MFTFRLAKIEIGPVAIDGGMGTELAVLGKTYQDTAKLVQEDPELTEHYSEENDDPEVVIGVRGKTKFNFSIMNPDVDTLQKTLGGTITGAEDARKWNAPVSYQPMERSVKITPQAGLVINIPRGMVIGKINADYAKKGIFLIEMSITALSPTKAGESTISAEPLP